MEQQLVAPKRSMYHIREDHYSLLLLIEEAEGELTPEIEEALLLTEEDFNNKAISYAYVTKEFDDNVSIVENEIVRLTKIKQRLSKRSELFKERLSEAMLQFKVEKIETPTLTLSFRKSKPVEMADSFEDSVLKYVDVKVEVNEGKVKEAKAQVPEGEELDPLFDSLEDIITAINAKPSFSKTTLGNLIKEGKTIPGVSIVEKKNLQIK
jgi:hypothetical protein